MKNKENMLENLSALNYKHNEIVIMKDLLYLTVYLI